MENDAEVMDVYVVMIRKYICRFLNSFFQFCLPSLPTSRLSESRLRGAPIG